MEQPERANLLKQLKTLKAAGTSKTKCILVLWGIKKGGSKHYQRASKLYEELLEELEIQEQDSFYQPSTEALLAYKLNTCSQSLKDVLAENEKLRRDLSEALWTIQQLTAAKTQAIAALEDSLHQLKRLGENHDRLADVEFLYGLAGQTGVPEI